LTGLSKLTVVFHFSFVLLVALGVEALLRCPRRVRLVAVAAAASLSLAGLGVWLAPGVVAALAPAGRRAPSGAALSFAVESVRQARWIALAALATLWAGILAPRRAAPLVVAVVAADLALSLGHFNPIEASKGEPAVHYGGDAGSRLIQADGGTFRVAGLLPENAGMIARLETTGGYHTIETRAYASIHGFLDFREPALRPIYDLANIRYQRSTADLSAQGFDDAGAGVWRNRSALPRLFFAGECRGFADDDEMARYVAARPFEPSREVLLRSPECRRRPASEGSCRLREEAPYGEGYAGDCVVGEGGGWAVWSVLQYPGWTARVDEQPAVLVPADIAFYAVPLDAGTHRVALEYHSRGLRTGSWIAAVTGLVALGLLARRRGTLPRRRR